MPETQQTICDWARETFGPDRKLERIATRGNEEMAELLKLTSLGAPLEQIAEEAADVVVCLQPLFETCGVEMWDVVERVMKRNRARDWHVTGDGCGYHVRESE